MIHDEMIRSWLAGPRYREQTGDMLGRVDVYGMMDNVFSRTAFIGVRAGYVFY